MKNMNEVQKSVKSRKNKTAVIVIILLATLLLISLIIGVAGAWFQQSQNVTGDVTLGDPVQIQITQGGASVTSLTFSSTALPGDVYNQPISVFSPANTSTAVLRAKLTITNTDGWATPVTATTADAWVLNTDDYYYYNGTLTAQQTIDFVTEVVVPTTLTNVDANKINSIEIVVEALQHANGAATFVWTTAPTEWLAQYGNG